MKRLELIMNYLILGTCTAMLVVGLFAYFEAKFMYEDFISEAGQIETYNVANNK